MKARIPPKIPKQLKQEAERIAKNAYEQIREKENKDITRRVFKTMLYALHTKHLLLKAILFVNQCKSKKICL